MAILREVSDDELNEHEQTISCASCDATLQIKILEDFEVHYGPWPKFFTELPGYHCEGCDKTYLSDEEINWIIEEIEREEQGMHTEDPVLLERLRTYVESFAMNRKNPTDEDALAKPTVDQ